MVLLRQCILSGLLDRVARRVPGSEWSQRQQKGKYESCCSGKWQTNLKTIFFSLWICTTLIYNVWTLLYVPLDDKELLSLDRRSSLFVQNGGATASLPPWVAYLEVQQGGSKSQHLRMMCLTAIQPDWLSILAR